MLEEKGERSTHKMTSHGRNTAKYTWTHITHNNVFFLESLEVKRIPIFDSVLA